MQIASSIANYPTSYIDVPEGNFWPEEGRWKVTFSGARVIRDGGWVSSEPRSDFVAKHLRMQGSSEPHDPVFPVG